MVDMNMDGLCSPAVWSGFVARACAINEYAAPSSPAESHNRKSGSPAGEDSPGTDFNRRGSWSESGLFDAGWMLDHATGDDAGLIRRPGKDSGVSGSIGTITSKENGWPLFWCWSTSVPEFVAEKPYTRFAVYATLRHGGDFTAAARELASKGYGKPFPEVPIAVIGKAGGGELSEASLRFFLWMSELKHRVENDKWLWHGFLSRGGVTMLSALWKSGKSTLLAHLVRAFDGRDEEFLGLPIVPSRVLYISEEHEEMWAERRDNLGIGDHVGMICRPFKGRPSPAQWSEFIGKVVTAIADHQFDLVVMDTISKLWPVREENDANQVEDALMPLWNITNGGAALLLVHHNRKSDGKDFTGARGSGSLSAFCETLIEFRRNGDSRKDYKRLLNSGGRYQETPPQWLVELTPSGYITHGDPDELTPDQKAIIGVGNQDQASEWKKIVLAFLPFTEDEARTLDDIQTHVGHDAGRGVRREDIMKWLSARVGDGEMERVGTGVKGNPYRWHKVDSVPKILFRPPQMCAGTETGTESEDSE